MNKVPFYKKLNLRTKLIILYALTIVLPLLVIGEIVLSISGAHIVKQTVQLTQEATLQIQNNIKEMLLQYVDISNSISYDRKLSEYLDPSKKYESVLDVIKAYDDYLTPLNNYEFKFKSMKTTLKVFYENSTLLQNMSTYVYADEGIKNRKVYSLAKEAGGKPVWGVEDGAVFLSRMVKNLNDNTDMYVVALFINEDRIYSLINQSSPADRLVLICDCNGTVISSNDRKKIGATIQKEGYYKEIQKNKRIKSANYKDTKEYKIINEYLGEEQNLPDWNIITVVPVDLLLKDENRIKRIGLIISFASLAASCLVFITFLHKITYRIKVLVTKMKGINEGRFSIISDEGNYDEIGTVTRNFNRMVEYLQTLIFENYEASLKLKDIALKKREAELYALQSQINPHFLFNTLESLRMGLLENEDRKNAKVVTHLSKMLRKSLNWQGEIVPLSEEVEFTRNYMEIIKYRFQNKISYSMELPKELESCLIPKLTLQPLVENAIKHGIEPKSGPGAVEVSFYKKDDIITILVKDDGTGMTQETLVKLQQTLDLSEEIKKSGSLGIRNVHDRIRLHFGYEYGINIQSVHGEGTEIAIVIPAAI